MAGIGLYLACLVLLNIFKKRNGINHKKNWFLFWFVLNIFEERNGINHKKTWSIFWLVLSIFEERNGINHGKNRSNAEQGPLGSWTAIDKSTLHCSQLWCLLVVPGVLKYVCTFT